MRNWGYSYLRRAQSLHKSEQHIHCKNAEKFYTIGIMQYKPIKVLNEQTAKKIAAGEVIERPASVVRELLDNALDADATKITVELTGGGIQSIIVTDDGFGMSPEDLRLCTETHSTSKIESIDDLLKTTSLGFRGEALASIKAVSDLEITTTQQGPLAYHYFNGTVTKTSLQKGTRISVKNIFANFPARKKFLKLPATESKMCKQVFVDKALAHPAVSMTLKNDGRILFQLRPAETYKRRALDALNITEPEECFAEIFANGKNFSADIVLGLPEISKQMRNYMYVFANGRRIDEYGLLQAMDYGAAPFFPNGTHPVALLFLTVDPAAIDFNIHPAKKEARFSNYADIHHAVSSTINSFYKAHTVATLKKGFDCASDTNSPTLAFSNAELSEQKHYGNFQKRRLYEQSTRQNSFTPPANKIFSVADASRQYQSANTATDRPAYRPLDIPEASFKFLGQVAGTFIAVEKNDTLYLIDQHAAHERILFEKLKLHSAERQELLVPYRIESESEAEDTMISEACDALNKQGFHIEAAGDHVWIIDSVPVLWHGTEADLNADIKKAIADHADILHEILAMAACRAACKDGDILSPDIAFDLVQQTFALPEPLCPHGRPLWIVITREEMFKRIKRT